MRTLAETTDTFTPDTELSHGAYRLLRVIRAARAYTDPRGRTLRRVGQGYLAARCGHVSKRQIRRYLGELEQGGRLARIPHRRRFVSGRWWSIETQAYMVRDPHITAGHTKRTPVTGPASTKRRGRGSGAPKPPAAPAVIHDLPATCGHGYEKPAVCPLCRRGIPAYDD